MILILLALHSLFDFNMQFLSVCCIFFAVVMQGEGRKETTKKQRSKNRIYVRVCIACITAVSMYFVIPFTAFYANQWELARKLYPAYTEAELMLLERASSREEGEELADSILKSCLRFPKC